MSDPIRVGARALILEDESVLLVEFDDQSGLHYNLPGGGVEPDESIVEALKREAYEEASVEIEVGPLVLVVEYQPKRNSFWAGSRPGLSLIFACKLAENSRPQMPEQPDQNQTAVKWIKLADLKAVELLPHIAELIVEYAQKQYFTPVFLEEPIKPARVEHYLKLKT